MRSVERIATKKSSIVDDAEKSNSISAVSIVLRFVKKD